MQGDLDEGKTILLNQCFANHNEKDEIYPLTVEEIVEAQKADITLKQYFKRNAVLDNGLELKTKVAYAIKDGSYCRSPYKVAQLYGITTIFSTLGIPVAKRHISAIYRKGMEETSDPK